MSRGLGRLQRGLVTTIRLHGKLHGKPMTFGEIRASITQAMGAEPDAKLRASFERSLRRALHRLTRDVVIIAMGDGGPGDPLRYCFITDALGDTPEARALRKAVEADSGQEVGAMRMMRNAYRP
jgi:hypothetical protein